MRKSGAMVLMSAWSEVVEVSVGSLPSRAVRSDICVWMLVEKVAFSEAERFFMAETRAERALRAVMRAVSSVLPRVIMVCMRAWLRWVAACSRAAARVAAVSPEADVLVVADADTPGT